MLNKNSCKRCKMCENYFQKRNLTPCKTYENNNEASSFLSHFMRENPRVSLAIREPNIVLFFSYPICLSLRKVKNTRYFLSCVPYVYQSILSKAIIIIHIQQYCHTKNIYLKFQGLPKPHYKILKVLRSLKPKTPKPQNPFGSGPLKRKTLSPKTLNRSLRSHFSKTSKYVSRFKILVRPLIRKFYGAQTKPLSLTNCIQFPAQLLCIKGVTAQDGCYIQQKIDQVNVSRLMNQMSLHPVTLTVVSGRTQRSLGT
eukprot:TRINITY_DN599_c0_g1_i3.p1 TRINITY_DN599_c0_g1~~TRINITY_DN599_c0_g1_i3.p1  ORF type:complete len:255 (+),score=-33.97 TRINITY_DN599_c0_g1_i3:298-1062(+)